MTNSLKKLSPNLMVEDVNRTITFYQEVLGFTLLTTVPETGQFDWALMQRDTVEVMFQKRASLVSEVPALQGAEIGGSLTFFIEVVGIQELYAGIKDSVTLVQGMHTTFYGMQEFAIRDCNGYILVFAEPVQA